MPKRVITAAVGVAGLVVIGLGVASATVWRADDVLVATTTTTDHLIVTDPGVLELGGDPVTIRATTSGGDPVVLAIGRDTDVAGWVGTDAHAQVSGLSGWHELDTASVAADPSASPSASPSTEPSASSSAEPSASASASPSSGSDDESSVADPTDSDLWVAQATGDGSARLVWPAQPGRWSLLVAGTGDSAPTLSLSWPRVVTTPWLWPLVILGSLLALAAAALLARDWNRRRTGTEEPEWHPVTTGAMSTVGEPGTLTRRQIREAELARAARPRTGAVPRVGTPGRGTPQAGPTHDGSPVGSENDTVVLRAVPGDPAAPVPPAASEPPASAPVAPGVPTRAVPTRRALRTGAIPVVSAGQQPVRPEPGAPATPTSPASPASPASPGAPGTTEDDAADPKPAWLRGRRGAAAAEQPAAPTSSSGTAEPTTPAPAAPGEGATATDATEAIGTVRPRPATGASVPPPPPGAWVPVPPPSSAAGPASGPRSVSRPAWLPISAPGGDQPPAAPRPAAPGAPEAASPEADAPETLDPAEQAGSRADAWRRAWGLPSTDEPTTEQGEDR
ncbi:hypothetical protein [Cellulomonas sp. PhB150]|uniref:hypothetical protein n=1 Tax=Cellulomonas sp. PhB150 TaxID=2485188 RepID=UPI000FB6F796|nr:hypothetical protein [Cellulomonas sp. PhB150]ROS23203.1 hypothetical protein EDF34_3380 [Cellulomonas sp. PhB150]